MAVENRNNSSTTSRLYTLIYRMRSFFRLDKNGSVIGVKLTKEDVQKAVYPNNYIEGDGVTKITVSTTPPVNPQQGDLWVDIS